MNNNPAFIRYFLYYTTFYFIKSINFVIFARIFHKYIVDFIGFFEKQKPPKRRFTFSAVFLHIISTSKQPLRVVRGIYRSRARFRPAVSVVVKPLLIAKFQQELLQFIRYGTSSVPVR